MLKVAVGAGIIAVIIAAVIVSRFLFFGEPPKIDYLKAIPEAVEKGKSSTLEWSTSSVKEVEISDVGKVELSGSKTVSPTETTTYTLIARNEEGRAVERRVTIVVSPAPVILKGKDGKETVLVPEGWFKMGITEEEMEAAYQLAKRWQPDVEKSWYEAEKHRHQVWVDAFYMDKYEVTVGENTRRLCGQRRIGGYPTGSRSTRLEIIILYLG